MKNIIKFESTINQDMGDIPWLLKPSHQKIYTFFAPLRACVCLHVCACEIYASMQAYDSISGAAMVNSIYSSMPPRLKQKMLTLCLNNLCNFSIYI